MVAIPAEEWAEARKVTLALDFLGREGREFWSHVLADRVLQRTQCWIHSGIQGMEKKTDDCGTAPLFNESSIYVTLCLRSRLNCDQNGTLERARTNLRPEHRRFGGSILANARLSNVLKACLQICPKMQQFFSRIALCIPRCLLFPFFNSF